MVKLGSLLTHSGKLGRNRITSSAIERITDKLGTRKDKDITEIRTEMDLGQLGKSRNMMRELRSGVKVREKVKGD